VPVVVSVFRSLRLLVRCARHCIWRSSRFATSWLLHIVPAVHGFASPLLIVCYAQAGLPRPGRRRGSRANPVILIERSGRTALRCRSDVFDLECGIEAAHELAIVIADQKRMGSARSANVHATEYIIEGGTVPDGVSYFLFCLVGRRFAFVLGGSVRTKAIAISTHPRTAPGPMGKST
jgi:hypothetical protein